MAYPQRAWLVLHLDLVRPIATIHNVLDALAVLCVRSELPHLNEAQRDSCWRDVLTSDVMRDVPSADAPSVFHFVAATRAKGLHVLLSWRGKRFQSVVATDALAVATRPLRGLSLAYTTTGQATVESQSSLNRKWFARFLQLHKRLELLETDAGGVPSTANDEMAPTKLAMAISRDHNHEQLYLTPLTEDQRMMVAWCLSRIPHFQQVESEVCAVVVPFAGDVTTRCIRWCSVVRLARWVLVTRPR